MTCLHNYILIRNAWLLFCARNNCFFPCVLRSEWGEATVTALHHQEATGEEATVQALEVTMEVVVGTSQPVFLWGIFTGIVGKIFFLVSGSLVTWIFGTVSFLIIHEYFICKAKGHLSSLNKWSFQNRTNRTATAKSMYVLLNYPLNCYWGFEMRFNLQFSSS
jgi:hypothetical protein